MNEDGVRKEPSQNTNLKRISSHSNHPLPSLGEKAGPNWLRDFFKDTQGQWRPKVRLPWPQGSATPTCFSLVRTEAEVKSLGALWSPWFLVSAPESHLRAHRRGTGWWTMVWASPSLPHQIDTKHFQMMLLLIWALILQWTDEVASDAHKGLNFSGLRWGMSYSGLVSIESWAAQYGSC